MGLLHSPSEYLPCRKSMDQKQGWRTLWPMEGTTCGLHSTSPMPVRVIRENACESILYIVKDCGPIHVFHQDELKMRGICS